MPYVPPAANYVGDGTNRTFMVPFPYLDKAHVELRVNGVVTSAFTWLTDSSIQTTTAPPSGAAVRISRVTPDDVPVSVWTDGATWPSSALNNALLQTLYNTQEGNYLVDQLNVDLVAAVDAANAAAQLATDAAGSIDFPDPGPSDALKSLRRNAGNTAYEFWTPGTLASLNLVGATHINANAVQTSKIQDAAVTLPKLSADTQTRLNLKYRDQFGGPVPVRVDNDVVQLPAGLWWVSDAGLSIYELPSNINVSMASTGAGGLIGSEVAATWYYIWLFQGDSGITASFAASGSTPTAPAGYTAAKARFPVPFYNDASSNLRPQIINFVGGRYEIYHDTASTSLAVYGSLQYVSDVDWRTVSAAAFAPPNCTRIRATFWINQQAGGQDLVWRPMGSSHAGTTIMTAHSFVGENDTTVAEICTNATQQFQWRILGGTKGVNLAVHWFFI